jgi:hypothetical protein
MSLAEADRPAEPTDDDVLPPHHGTSGDDGALGTDEGAAPIYAEVVAERGDPTEPPA